MARTPRDTKAEYAARKAKLAAQGTTLAKQRRAEAQRRGYANTKEQERRRKVGALTHADQAEHAKRQGGGNVDNLGGGRWTFTTPFRREGLTEIERFRLSRTMDRANRADVNVTITATWRSANGRTGTAQAGGSYGIRVRGFHNEGDDGLTSIENQLFSTVGGSELPDTATITSLSLFFFPAEQRRAA